MALIHRLAAGLTARLDFPGLNTGEAAGDSYSGIEGLIGSNFADTLVGNGAANTLFGHGGNDTIHGLAAMMSCVAAPAQISWPAVLVEISFRR